MNKFIDHKLQNIYQTYSDLKSKLKLYTKSIKYKLKKNNNKKLSEIS